MGDRGADPLIGAVLDDAEDLLLHLEGDEADLIEEERTPLCFLESPLAGLLGTGEGTLLVAEELGLDQGGREGRAVHGDQILLPPGREEVQAPGGDLLAAAPLADEQHRSVHRRRTAELALELEEDLALPQRLLVMPSAHYTHDALLLW